LNVPEAVTTLPGAKTPNFHAKIATMRGRKPRPPYLKALAGQRTGVQPQSFESVGEPPAGMTAARKAIWWEVVGAAPLGLLTRADRGTLELYVVAFDRWMQAVAMGDKKGFTSQDVRHKHTARVAPWERIERSRCAQVATLAGMLGLTPMSRSGLYLPPPPADEPSELEKMLSELDERDRQPLGPPS
jgi:P27 family predicted phage terminase small subunit